MESQLDTIAKQKATEYSLVFDRIQKEAASLSQYAGIIFARQDINTDISTRMLMPWNGTTYALDNVTSKVSREIRNLQRIKIVLQTITSNNQNLSLGYMGTESGITVFSDESVVDVIKERNAYVVYKREWYMQAKKAGKAIWTKPYVDANSGELVVTCAVPVYKPDDTIAGVIGFDVLLNTIQNDILKLNIGYGSYAFMIDKSGKALVRPGMTQKDARWDETYSNDDLSKTVNPEFNKIIANMMKARTGTELYNTETGEKYIAYAPLQGIDSSLGIVVSRNLVLKPAKDLQWQILMIVAVVLVIAVCIGMFLGNNIVTPLNRLTVVANLISQGKMELEVMNEERKDEIGVLTKSINRLVISLKLAMDR
jgi:two-component system sensor histidine kinase/response regulator